MTVLTNQDPVTVLDSILQNIMYVAGCCAVVMDNDGTTAVQMWIYPAITSSSANWHHFLHIGIFISATCEAIIQNDNAFSSKLKGHHCENVL